MINNSTLKAFGFRKLKKLKKRGPRISMRNRPKGTWYSPKLQMHYTPRLHTDKQFAINLSDRIIEYSANFNRLEGITQMLKEYPKGLK